jgi:hypothetical protein
VTKPGRVPIDFEQLDLWDAEWYLAFYRLREGGELPLRTTQWWTRRQIDFNMAERLSMLRGMSPEEYWAYHLAKLPGGTLDWGPPPLAKNREQAARLQADEIAALARWADPAVIQRRQEGVEIWHAIWRARTLPAAERACRRWIAFSADPAFPTHLLVGKTFLLTITGDARFPTTPAADDTRLNMLAAGMAGASIGISPRTAIHRVRTLKHEAGGPLWNDNASRCECWRCDRAREVQVFDTLIGAFTKDTP